MDLLYRRVVLQWSTVPLNDYEHREVHVVLVDHGRRLMQYGNLSAALRRRCVFWSAIDCYRFVELHIELCDLQDAVQRRRVSRENLQVGDLWIAHCRGQVHVVREQPIFPMGH